MRFVRVVVCCVFLTLFSAYLLTADSLILRSKTLTVLGTLTGDVSIVPGATGWSIQLNPVIMLDGKQISSLEVKTSAPHRLASLEDKYVQAKGKLTFSSGAYTTEPPVFELSWIKEHKPKGPQP